MEMNGADIPQAQVVYYLSKSGKMDPPHMMDVRHSSNVGLRLKDVKQRLAVLRGSALPNMFSWSYKRSYKNKYIWLDLSEEDVIVPGRDGEYILKGSELIMIDDCQDKMMKHSINPDAVNNKLADVHQSKFRGAEMWLNKELTYKSDSQELPLMLHARYNQGKISPTEQVRSKRKMIDNYMSKDSLETGVSTGSDESQQDRKISSCSDFSDSSPQKSTDVEVSKRDSPVLANSSCFCEMATQTEENHWRDATASRLHASSASQLNAHNAFSDQWKVFDQKHVHDPSQAEASLLSMISGDLEAKQSLTSSETSKCDQSHDKQSTKFKHTSASRVIFQLLSCGGIDTKVQNVFAKNEVKLPAVSKIKKSPRRQLSRLLQGPSPPSSHPGSKSVTPKSNRSPESLSSRMGTPIGHSCELDLENTERNDAFTLSIPPSSEIGLMTALTSPSYDTELSNSDRRCSSFSSRMLSRSQEFKDTRTTFDSLCKTPTGSPTLEHNIKPTSASREVSPIHTSRESWTSISQRVYPSQAAKSLYFTEKFQKLQTQSNWKDLRTVKEIPQLGQVSKRVNDKLINGRKTS